MISYDVFLALAVIYKTWFLPQINREISQVTCSFLTIQIKHSTILLLVFFSAAHVLVILKQTIRLTSLSG